MKIEEIKEDKIMIKEDLLNVNLLQVMVKTYLLVKPEGGYNLSLASYSLDAIYRVVEKIRGVKGFEVKDFENWMIFRGKKLKQFMLDNGQSSFNWLLGRPICFALLYLFEKIRNQEIEWIIEVTESEEMEEGTEEMCTAWARFLESFE